MKAATMYQLSMHTPLGDLSISVANSAIVSLDWGWARNQNQLLLLQDAKYQLDEYFDGHRKRFELPLAPLGTNYQQRVWSLISQIPYRKTETYGSLARALNSSARAVGNACGANPIPIIIPCHRVLAANGIGGYSGEAGVETKIALLRLEGAML